MISSGSPTKGGLGLVEIVAIAIALAVLASAWPSILASSTSNEEWSMLGGNPERTGSRGEVVGPGTGEVLWRHETPYGVDSSPSYSDGKVFITYGSWEDEGGIHALSANDGTVLWQVEGFGPIFTSALVSDEIVVVGSAEEQRTRGQLTALNSEDGELIWQRTLNGRPAESLIHDGVLYTADRPPGTFFGTFYALNLQNGEELWRVEDSLNPRGIVYSDANRLIISYQYGKIFLLDTENQTVIWEHHAEGELTSAPTSYGNIVMVFTDQGAVALDKESGELVWSHEKGQQGPMNISPIVVSGKHAIIPDNPVRKVDIESGITLNSFDFGMLVGAAMHKDIMYVATYRGDLWSQPFSPQFFEVIVADIEEGTVYWNFSIPYTYAAPIMIDGILYQPFLESEVGDHDEPGGVIALDAGYLAALERGDIPGPSAKGDNSLPIPMAGALFLVGVVLLVVLTSQLRRNQQP